MTMTKGERVISEAFSSLSEINRAYFLAILRSLSFAQKQTITAPKKKRAQSEENHNQINM